MARLEAFIAPLRSDAAVQIITNSDHQGGNTEGVPAKGVSERMHGVATTVAATDAGNAGVDGSATSRAGSMYARLLTGGVNFINILVIEATRAVGKLYIQPLDKVRILSTWCGIASQLAYMQHADTCVLHLLLHICSFFSAKSAACQY